MENNTEWDSLIGSDEFCRYFFKKQCEDKAKAYRTFACFSPEQLVTYKEKLEQLIKHHEELASKTKTTKDTGTTNVGNLLEELVTYIFECLSIFNAVNKIRTNSNEIDHIVSLSIEGFNLKNVGLISLNQNYFIGESKNYDGTIGVTWVNKLFSLMSSTTTNFGIIFSFYGLTGAERCGGWQEAKGFTKKILLSSSGLLSNNPNEETAIYIIDFNIKHFKLLAQGKSILEIIENEKMFMKLDVRVGLTDDVHEKQSEIINLLKNNS